MNNSYSGNSPQSFTQIDQLLINREAKVLTWSIIARLAFLILFIVLLLLHLAGILNPGIVAEKNADAVSTIVIIGIGTILMVISLFYVLRRQHIMLVGSGAVFIDLAMLSILPVVWLNSLKIPDGSPAFLMKNELFTLSMVVLVINSLTLRPAYPALMSAGILAIHCFIIYYVLHDPRVEVTNEYLDHFSSKAVNPGIMFIRVIIIAIIGTILSFVAWLARRTLRDAVNLELNNHAIREQQAELIHEGKMSAMSGLVAGVMHEVNTPLGALKSSTDTVSKSVARLADVTSGIDTGGEISRILHVLQKSELVAQQANERISELVRSLKEFTSLDTSEVQKTDIPKAIQTTLSLIDNDVKGQVLIQENYREVPLLNARPREINQMFYTMLMHSFETLRGNGNLTLSVAENNGTINTTISDDGPGMSSEQLASLFDIGFSADRGRMTMGLGLPMSQKIAQNHGGRISVDSAPGAGTTFNIVIPIDKTSG